MLSFWIICCTCFFHLSFESTWTSSTCIVVFIEISWSLKCTVLIRFSLRFLCCFVKWISWYLSGANLASCHFAHAMHQLWVDFNLWQFVCAEIFYVTKFVSFTNSNVMILFFDCSNVVSSSDMKNRKRIEKSEDSCEISEFVWIQSLLKLKKTIFVQHSFKKQFITWIIQDEKSAIHMMCNSLSCETLSNVSLKFRLSIDIIHFDFVFHTVLTHDVSSSRTVKVNLCFLALIWFHKKKLCISVVLMIHSVISFFMSFVIVFLNVMKQ